MGRVFDILREKFNKIEEDPRLICNKEIMMGMFSGL